MQQRVRSYHTVYQRAGPAKVHDRTAGRGHRYAGEVQEIVRPEPTPADEQSGPRRNVGVWANGELQRSASPCQADAVEICRCRMTHRHVWRQHSQHSPHPKLRVLVGANGVHAASEPAQLPGPQQVSQLRPGAPRLDQFAVADQPVRRRQPDQRRKVESHDASVRHPVRR